MADDARQTFSPTANITPEKASEDREEHPTGPAALPLLCPLRKSEEKYSQNFSDTFPICIVIMWD